jgi:hypothetical protein
VDELFGVWNGQWLQQNGVDDREDRRVGADADRQCQDGRNGESAIFPEQPSRETEVVGNHSVI